MLFMFYEEMSKDLRGTIGKVADFLKVDLNDVQLDKLEDHLRIENFRENKSVNYDALKELGILVKGEQEYVRKGKTSGWRSYFDEELNRRADNWIEENLKDAAIEFPDFNSWSVQ